MPEWRGTLALRLALLFTAVVGVLAVGGGTLLYRWVEAHSVAELDADLSRQTGELRSILENEGLDEFRQEIAGWEAIRGREDYVARLLAPDGRVLATTNAELWTRLPPGGQTSRPGAPRTLYAGVSTHARSRVLGVRLPDSRVLQVGLSLADVDGFLARLRGAGLTILACVLVLGAFAGGWLAHRAMYGVHAVRRAATRIADGHFDERVDVRGEGSEIEALVASFNRMAERVGTVLGEMRQVNDNIAHDLRSPLTRLRAQAEAAAADPALGEAGRALAGGVVEECDRLVHITNTMLDIAEAESGGCRLVCETLDAGALLAETRALFADVADERGLALTAESAPGLVFPADRRLLQRALSNLVDNALKYTPAGGTVALAVADDAGDVCFSVCDDGPGIAPADLPRVFERFYRADGARSRPGNGLGLALVRAIAHAHGGRAEAEPRERGVCFRLWLPRGKGSFDPYQTV